SARRADRGGDCQQRPRKRRLRVVSGEGHLAEPHGQSPTFPTTSGKQELDQAGLVGQLPAEVRTRGEPGVEGPSALKQRADPTPRPQRSPDAGDVGPGAERRVPTALLRPESPAPRAARRAQLFAAAAKLEPEHGAKRAQRPAEQPELFAGTAGQTARQDRCEGEQAAG
ncbi:unnamed protein product, partial [Effrenium voratum]